MRKRISVSVVVICVLVFVSLAFFMGQRPPAKKTHSAKITQEVFKITGRVTGCNWPKSTVTVLAGYRDPVVMVIDKNTVISKAKNVLQMNDIKNGDYVTVSYAVKKGVNIAKSIRLEGRASVPAMGKR